MNAKQQVDEAVAAVHDALCKNAPAMALAEKIKGSMSADGMGWAQADADTILDICNAVLSKAMYCNDARKHHELEALLAAIVETIEEEGNKPHDCDEMGCNDDNTAA